MLALAFSPDGRWLATSGKDSALYLWNVARQRPVSLYKSLAAPATSLSMSPDGTRLALTIVHFYDGRNAELDVYSQIPHLKALARVRARAGTQIQFSRDGQRVFLRRRFRPRLDARHAYVDAPWRARWASSPAGANSRSAPTSGWSPSRPTTVRLSSGTCRRGRPIGGCAARRRRATREHSLRRPRRRSSSRSTRNGRGYVWDVRPPSSGHNGPAAIAGRTLTRAEWHDALPERDYAPECGR